MKNPFPVQVCPLCQEVLKFKKLSGVNVWDCPASVNVTGQPESHYKVEYDSKMCVQHVIIAPYGIDTYASDHAAVKSRIYKVDADSVKWRFIKEVPKIDASNEEHLRNRIATFLPFV